jgi:mono/diheme cytochrome c family protein
MRYTTVWFIVILAGFTAAASRLMYGQFDAGRYSQENSGAIAQPAPPKETEGASYSVAAYPLYPPDLAPGAGREAVQSYCTTCHSTRYITMQPPLPPETWAAEVDKMIKVMGQPIPEDVQSDIIKYLQTNYTPQNRKR